jgi:hypothetical protein
MHCRDLLLSARTWVSKLSAEPPDLYRLLLSEAFSVPHMTEISFSRGQSKRQKSYEGKFRECGGCLGLLGWNSSHVPYVSMMSWRLTYRVSGG